MMIGFEEHIGKKVKKVTQMFAVIRREDPSII